MVMPVRGEFREVLISLRHQLDFRTPHTNRPQKVITLRPVDAEEILKHFDIKFDKIDKSFE
jgi:hypothetical protein